MRDFFATLILALATFAFLTAILYVVQTSAW